MTRRKILCLEGGGVNGVFAAQILADVEDELREQGKPHFAGEYFDLIAGTSTGGIIALGLALRIPARTILEFYLNKSSLIFPRRRVARELREKVRFAALNKTMYANTELIGELKSAFEDKTLGDAKTRLIIPSYFLDGRKMVVFKTRHHALFQHDYKLPAWEVAAATSAAPYYLDSYKMEDERAFADGGIWANNPSMVAVAEAVEYCGWSAHDIDILSINGVRNVLPEGAERAPATLVSLIMDAQSKGSVALAKTVIGATEARDGVLLGTMTELEHVATEGEFDLDNAGAVPRLAGVGRDCKRANNRQLANFFGNGPVEPFIVV